MSQESDIPDAVQVYTTKSEHYEKYHVSAARGGLQPRGDMKIDFVVDYQRYPEVEERELADDGRLGRPVDESELEVTSEIQTSLMMDQETCFSIATWMIAQNVGDLSQEQVQSLIIDASDNIESRPPHDIQ